MNQWKFLSSSINLSTTQIKLPN